MQKSGTRIRLAISELAARHIAENGLITYHAAKRKAADQLGYNNKRNLPANSEIERAVIAYQNLFQNSLQPQVLTELRHIAVEIMNQFVHFNPRLVGSVLTGTAGNHSEIIIHLFSDNPEAVNIQLMENNIPYKNCEKRIRSTDKNSELFPAHCFLAGHVPIVLILFPEKYLKQSPVSSIDEKLMKRANIKKVQSLLQETG